jgi:hypothetical protein
MKKPLQYVLSTIACLFLTMISVLALVGVMLLFFFLMSGLRMTDNVLPFAIVGAALGLLLLYFTSAFKGALMKAYSVLYAGGNFTFLDIYRYAIANGWIFFIINIIKFVLLLMVNLPSILLYLYVAHGNPDTLMKVIIIFLSLCGTFIIELLFYPVYLGAVYGNGLGRSFVGSFQLFRRKHVIAVALFIVYCFVWLFDWIPLLQVVAGLVAYPIVVTAMLAFYQTYVGRK